MTEFSVITIVKGRRAQLYNQFAGILRSTTLPKEYVVVAMDDDPIELPPSQHITVRVLRIPHDTKTTLPLAEARNYGFKSATSSNSIFIDVDCIPSETVFEQLLQHTDSSTITCAYPRYLGHVPKHFPRYADLKATSVAHPGRSHISPYQPIDHNLFWSLIFAARKQTFMRIGGFDESFTGYGAEDTDFAYTAHQSGVNFMLIDDTVLHQYHDKYDPPMNYFEDIIANARRFYEKWGKWPMKSWLDAFALRGLITRSSTSIDIIRPPTDSEVAAAHSKSPY